MPRLAAAVLALAIIGAVGSAGAKPALASNSQPAPLQGIGSEYLALGDSLATGVGSSHCPLGCAGTSGYVAAYAQQLSTASGHPVRVRDLGVNGETSNSFIGDYSTNPASHSQLARAVAEIRAHGGAISPVTLDIGGNDALTHHGARYSTSDKLAVLDNVQANLQFIVATLQTELARAGARADLVLMTYYEPYGSDDPDLWALARLNSIIRDIAAGSGAHLGDPYPAFVGIEQEATWMSCNCMLNIHPNDRGYHLIAAALAAATYSPAAALTGSVAGIVSNADGSAAGGALVWYGGAVTQGDAHGHYRIDGVPAGLPLRFGVTNGDDMAAAEVTLTVAANSALAQDFVLGTGSAAAARPGEPSVNSRSGMLRIMIAELQAAVVNAGKQLQATASANATHAAHDTGSLPGTLGKMLGVAWQHIQKVG